MKVFITGGTGFIGSAVVPELLAAGHEVLGLARSEASASALLGAGARVHRGSLEDFDRLRQGVQQADGVIHLGFVHDFSRYKAYCELDRQVIETLGQALESTDQPLVITSGAGSASTEEDPLTLDSSQIPRLASEEAANAVVAQGRRAMVVRASPSVHGQGDRKGFISMLVALAREKRVSAYIGDGANRWNAVHRSDAAKVFVRALEHGEAGGRYHAVGESEIPFHRIAKAIGQAIGVPAVSITKEQAEEHFGWLGVFVGIDCPVSSELTQQRLSWTPRGPTLLDDLANGVYA